jgi:hypothetical protein
MIWAVPLTSAARLPKVEAYILIKEWFKIK